MGDHASGFGKSSGIREFFVRSSRCPCAAVRRVRLVVAIAMGAVAGLAIAAGEAEQQLQLTREMLAKSRSHWSPTGDGTFVDPARLGDRIAAQDRTFTMMRGQVLYIEAWEDRTSEKREETIQAYKDLTKDALKQTGFAVLKNAKRLTEGVKKLPIGSKAREKLEKLMKDRNFVAHLEKIEQGAENLEEMDTRVNQIMESFSGDMDQVAALKELAGEVPVLGDLVGLADMAAGYGNAFADTGTVLMDATQITDLRSQLAINEKRFMFDGAAIRRTQQMLETLASHGERLASYRYDDSRDDKALDAALDKQLDEIEVILAGTGVARHAAAAQRLRQQRAQARDEQIARHKAEEERAKREAEATKLEEDRQELESVKFARSWGASCAGWFPDFFKMPSIPGSQGSVFGVNQFQSPVSRKKPSLAGGDTGVFQFHVYESLRTSDDGKKAWYEYNYSSSPASEEVGTLLVSTAGRRCEITSNKVSVEIAGESNIAVTSVRDATGRASTLTSPVPGEPLTVSVKVHGAAKMNKYQTQWGVRLGSLVRKGGFVRQGAYWVAQATVIPRHLPMLVDFTAKLGGEEAFAIKRYQVAGRMPSVERLVLKKMDGELAPAEELSIAIPNDREVAGVRLRSEALLSNGQRVSPSNYGEGLDKVSLTVDRPDIALLSMPVGINSHEIGIGGLLPGRAVVTLRHRPDPRVGRETEIVQRYPVVVREFSVDVEQQGNTDVLRLAALGPDQGMGSLGVRWIGAPPGQGGSRFSRVGGVWRSDAVPAAGVSAVEVLDANGRVLTTLDVASRLDGLPAVAGAAAAGTAGRLTPGISIKTVTNLSGHNPLHTSQPVLNFGGQTVASVADLVTAARTGRVSSGSSSGCVRTVTMRTTVAGPPAIYSGNFNLSSTTLQCTTVPPGLGGAAEVFSITDAPGDAANTAYYVGSNPGPTSGWNYATATYVAGNQVSFTATSTSGRQARITFKVTQNNGGNSPSTLQVISIEALN